MTGQDLPRVHVFLLKKSDLKGVFIRTNDPHLAICFPPSLLLSVPPILYSFLLPFSSLSLPQFLPSFLSSFYYPGFSILSHIVGWFLLLTCLHVWMNQGHNFQCQNTSSSTFSWFIKIGIVWLLYAKIFHVQFIKLVVFQHCFSILPNSSYFFFVFLLKLYLKELEEYENWEIYSIWHYWHFTYMLCHFPIFHPSCEWAWLNPSSQTEALLAVDGLLAIQHYCNRYNIFIHCTTLNRQCWYTEKELLPYTGVCSLFCSCMKFHFSKDSCKNWTQIHIISNILINILNAIT